MRPKTLQLVQERAGNTREGIGKVFLSRTQAAQQLKEMMDKWDYVKLKSFCTTKLVVSRLKRSPTDGEKYLLSIYIRQRIDNQYIQGGKKIKLSKN
jgi:hypothetical protein